MLTIPGPYAHPLLTIPGPSDRYESFLGDSSFPHIDASRAGWLDAVTAVMTNDTYYRAMLLEGWLDACTVHGDDEREAAVQARMPKRIKKKRPLQGDDGEDAGWEEYFDYIFPDEEKKAPSLKILEMAQKWKKQKTDDD